MAGGISRTINVLVSVIDAITLISHTLRKSEGFRYGRHLKTSPAARPRSRLAASKNYTRYFLFPARQDLGKWNKTR